MKKTNYELLENDINAFLSAAICQRPRNHSRCFSCLISSMKGKILQFRTRDLQHRNPPLYQLSYRDIALHVFENYIVEYFKNHTSDLAQAWL